VSDPTDRPLSALPSRLARALAFAAILIGGAAGGIVGWAFVMLQCDGDCTLAAAVGAGVVAVLAALGTAVLSVLVLRTVGGWRPETDLGNR
jgi:hypothetical protein